MNTLAFGKLGGVTIDLTPYTAVLGTKPTAATISAMVDKLNTDLMGGRMSSTMHQTIVSAAGAAATPKAMAQTAVYLIGSSWNYQVER
jgi:hypothetical protein